MLMLMGGRLYGMYGISYSSHNCSINRSTPEKINNGLDVMALYVNCNRFNETLLCGLWAHIPIFIDIS